MKIFILAYKYVSDDLSQYIIASTFNLSVAGRGNEA